MISEKRAHNFDDKTGKRYGDLVVLELNGFKVNKIGKRKSLWKCLCDCGQDLVVIAGNLSSGNTTNCGCKNKIKLQEYVDNILRLPFGEASFNALYAKYKYGAKSRNLEFDLPKNIFRTLCTSKCFYCGTEPKTIEKSPRANGGFVYNGIDRADNELGYAEFNCVTCCIICNIMKHVLEKDKFLQHIENIYKNTKGKKDNG